MTTYYLREGGTAANKEAASGPGSSAAACMSAAMHNSEASEFSAADIVKLCDDGGDIRGTGGGDPILLPVVAGVTYEPESGDSPVLNGSQIVTGWTEAEEALGAASHGSDTTGDTNVRVILPAATFAQNGALIRVKFMAHLSSNTTLTAAYIGEKAAAGDAFDMQPGTITELLFSAGSGKVIAAGTSEWSDWTAYAFDKTKDYLISFGITDNLNTLSGGLEFYRKWAASSGEAGTADVAGQTGPNVGGRVVADMEVRYGANIWQASFNPDDLTSPTKVFFDDTLGTLVGSIAACDGTREWYHDTADDTLYVYAVSDPDALYTSPGVEANDIINCFYVNNTAAIVIDGIDCKRAQRDGIKYTGTSKDGEVKNLEVYENGQNGYLQTGTATNTALLNVVSHDNGIDTSDHGFYMGCQSNVNGAWLQSDCVAYANAGTGFTYERSGSGTARRCLSYGNGRQGFDLSNGYDDSNYNLEYCIAYDNAWIGFRVIGMGGDHNGNNDIYHYNCIAYSNNTHGGFFFNNNNDADTNITTRNCASVENADADLFVDAGQAATFDLDYNDYFRASGTMIDYDGTTYTQAQFAAYQSAESQDANSISQDPLMTDPANADFTISDSSPCFDAGIPVGLSSDYFGNAVPQGAAPDIGIHEVAVAVVAVDEMASSSIERLRWPLHRRLGHSQRY